MKCDNCGREADMLETIGSEFICKKCICKNKTLGWLFRTHADTYQFVVRKLKPKDYVELVSTSRDAIIDLIQHPQIKSELIRQQKSI